MYIENAGLSAGMSVTHDANHLQSTYLLAPSRHTCPNMIIQFCYMVKKTMPLFSVSGEQLTSPYNKPNFFLAMQFNEMIAVSLSADLVP